MFALPFSELVPFASTVVSGAIDFTSAGTVLGWGLLALVAVAVLGILSQAAGPQVVSPGPSVVARPVIDLDHAHRDAA